MLALGRLLRLSLAPSALADIAAGVVLGAGHWPRGPAPFLLMAGSACVYHGGMALNDWSDRAEDARLGRPRPIPRGEIAAPVALALAAALLVLGPALAWLAAPRAGACLGTVALLAALYDLAGRGAWIGPVLLGACRAGNLAAGMALGVSVQEATRDYPFLSFTAVAPLLYGSYVLCVSRLARLEDRAHADIEQGHPERWAALAAGFLGTHAIPGLATTLLQMRDHVHLETLQWVGPMAALYLAGWGARGLLRALPERRAWSPADVSRVVGMGLRRLLIATASLSAQAGTVPSLIISAAILCGYPVSYALRRLFPPT